MQAIILAGGKGTRMAGSPEGYALKSAALIHGKPLIEWQLAQLKQNGIDSVRIITSEFTPKGILEKYSRNESQFGMRIEVEEQPFDKGSLGCIRDVLRGIPANESVTVLYGDIFSDINLRAMLEQHQREGSLATLAKIKGDYVRFGMIEDDAKGRITGFKEKGSLQYNSGVAVVSGQLGWFLPDGKDFFAGIESLHRKGLNAFGSYTHEGFWWDVATTKEVDEINQAVDEGRINLETTSSSVSSEIKE